MDVLYVPNLSAYLLSINRITENDVYGVTFRRDYVDIFDVNTDEIIFSGFVQDKMKYVAFTSALKEAKPCQYP